jgi:hypothetical protein
MSDKSSLLLEAKGWLCESPTEAATAAAWILKISINERERGRER